MDRTAQFIISAPASGAGKTTVSRGLMALLASKGMRVQPFKCGPDYIDTMFHKAACGRASVNLDSFFCDADRLHTLYATYAAKADAVVVEGMMGLFDGYDRDRGSSAEIAQWLGLPVVVVADAHAAYSLAPLLQGLTTFRRGLRVAGVIFNRVGSARHEALLRQVCADVGLECFGFIPRMDEGVMRSRYLGLDFAQDYDVAQTARAIETHVDWRRLLEATATERPQCPHPTPKQQQHRRMAVARNKESFAFIYQEHIDIMRAQGDITFFDPEQDEPIATDTDLLYLPGGYPEKHAQALASAATTRRSIADYAARGGKILAECGGMMYLCETIETDDGAMEMCGVLPYTVSARTADRRLSLGYRQFSLDGRMFRGHEFHYSQFSGPTPKSDIQVYNANGKPVATPVFRQGGVLASYTHLYWNDGMMP